MGLGERKGEEWEETGARGSDSMESHRIGIRAAHPATDSYLLFLDWQLGSIFQWLPTICQNFSFL